MAPDDSEPVGTEAQATRLARRFARNEQALYGSVDDVTGVTLADLDAALAAPPLPGDEPLRRGPRLPKSPDRYVSAIAAAGCKYPRITVEEAATVGLPLSYALAFLEKESSGTDSDGSRAFGLNLFGHDAVANPVKGGFVTESRYDEYLHHRRAGRGAQGVGPCQLTWWEFQDRADALGGCWKPECNMRVGFGVAKALID